MSTLKQELGTLFIIILASSLALFFTFSNNSKNKFSIITPIQDPFKHATKEADQSITPTPVMESTSWTSSDGKMQVNMEKQISNGQHSYTFSVTQTSDNNKKGEPLFSQTVDANTSFSIPYNTFSPDNKYLFLEEKDKNAARFLVFNSSGKPFANGDHHVEVSSLFEKYTSNYTLKEVTGWASETLLIIRTSGPSFWLDVTSRSFTQLSTRF